MSVGSSLADRAREFARAAHAGQVDKQGRDYFTHHLTPIAESLADHGGLVVAVGWLHDVVEDTDATLATVCSEFGPEVAGAVDAVTRRPGERYFDFIARAARHPVGRLAKIKDNARNLGDLDALAEVDPVAATSLRPRYEKARGILLEAAAAGDAAS